MRLSVCFLTGRQDPRLEWVIEDLERQAHGDDEITVIVIDALGRIAHELVREPITDLEFARYGETVHRASSPVRRIVCARPKPNIWQGPHRITRADWWATANARNTAIVLCPDEYLAFLDDRAHLGPRWLDVVRRGASERASVLAGSYDKIEDGRGDVMVASDHRRAIAPGGRVNCGGGWLYGCTFALPLEWALEVNGFEEGCDGLTGEDYIFGLMLGNRGRRVDFAPELYVRQDRASGNVTCKGLYACRDKGTAPHDKSHAALARFGRAPHTEFTPDLRELRRSVLGGGEWPVPDRAYDYRDWFDGQLIREMEAG